MKNWLQAFLVYKAIVFLLALVALGVFAHIWPASPAHFIGLMYQWDAKHILRVASEGYRAAEPSIQVYPFFPMLIRLFQLVFRDWHLAGILAAQVSSFFAFYYFYRLARLDLKEADARTALILFALFPTAYFLSVPYSEAGFCALSFATVFYLKSERYRTAAATGALTALSRLNGMLLIPALVVHAWVNRKTLSRRQLKGILGIAAAMSGGWFVYLCMNRYLYDNWTYFLAQTSKQWGINLALPFTGVWTAIQMWGGRSAEEKITIIIMEVGFTLVALALTPLLARRSRALEFTYVALNMLLFVSMDFWLSRPRYLLTLFPLFIAVAPWISRGPLRLALYLFGSAALFGIYWALYLNAQWAH